MTLKSIFSTGSILVDDFHYSFESVIYHLAMQNEMINHFFIFRKLFTLFHLTKALKDYDLEWLFDFAFRDSTEEESTYDVEVWLWKACSLVCSSEHDFYTSLQDMERSSFKHPTEISTLGFITMIRWKRVPVK
jgi:hypothetical protein